jgi:DNA-binding CsgD family transcriptional regulator
MRPALLFLALLALSPLVAADESARRFLHKPDSWFASAEAKKVATIILSFQCDAGGWPKNTDTISKAYEGDRTKLVPTFDNKATVDELRFMAHMFNATQDETYRKSFDRGLAYVLTAQYPNGGWPQFFPLRKGYFDHITFNDDAMVRVLRLVREAMGRLPDRYRDILLLTYVSELPYSEVARVLKMTEGGVRILKLRALRKLETLLPPEMGI